MSFFNKMSPKTKQYLVVGCLIAVILLFVTIGVKTSERTAREVKGPETTKSVLIDKSESRNQTMEALASEIRKLNNDNKQQQRQIAELENQINRQGGGDASVDPKKLNKTIQDLRNQVQDLQEQLKGVQRVQVQGNNPTQEIVENILGPQKPEDMQGVSDGSKNETDISDSNEDGVIAPLPTDETTAVNKPFPKGNDNSNLPPDSIFGGEPIQKGQIEEPKPTDTVFATQEPPKTNSGGDTKISIISENTGSEEDEDAKKKKDQYLFLPAGSIITGVILNGMDAPTGQASREHQFPSLIRIQKEAILPNRFRSDIRECFVIVSGYGDLSSERAYLRGETLSCVRKDRRIIEGSLDSYAVGEDGKSGLRGRLVSKQGQIIAKSLMAGFLSGLSKAFDVNATPTINTSSNGTVSYEKVYSSSALQGAATKGISSALERVADFYIKMAEGLYPVIEIDAGRRIDLILTKGAKVTLQDIDDSSLSALESSFKKIDNFR